MKKTILVIVQMFLLVAAFSQQINQQPTLTRQDYLEKSKSNRTAGFILLGVGVGFTTGGIISLQTADWLFGDDYTPFVLMTAGIGSMLGSIPMFVIAGNQSRKAAALSGSFKLESLPRESYGIVKNKSIPAVSVVLKF